MNAVAEVRSAAVPVSAPPAAGTTVYTGHCYDKRLRRCRVYGVANGEGGTEWRVVRESFDSDPDQEVERCFHSYAEAMKWIA
jgi:hypothetical protein